MIGPGRRSKWTQRSLADVAPAALAMARRRALLNVLGIAALALVVVLEVNHLNARCETRVKAARSIALHPPPPPPPAVVSLPPLVWESAVASEAKTLGREGAGLLFFAYGGQKTLNHFLKEAANAARSFREHNPSIRIAVVTNNATVDGRIFDVHISPREDLMFAGENLQKRADRVMRQWLTRLYYLAHSPFKVTWALDSNVLSCTPGAAQAFLDAALATDLWGFHIAHGSQNIASETMYPHNWNLAFRSDAMVVGLMREWFSLQVQQGVASDDQSTLHVAELYFRKAYGKRGFRVGQIAPSFGTAWQNVVQTETHHVKITNRLDGPVHVIHSTNASQCEALNLLGRTVRQVVATRVEDDVRPRRFRLESVLTAAQCEAMMEGAGRAARAYCKLGNASAAGAPTIVPAPPVRGVVNAELETLADFLASGRCDRHLCGEPPPKKRAPR